MINVILWDVDATLLNFKKAESYAIRTCFSHFHMGECNDEMLSQYSKINESYWRRLERGEITKAQVLTGRFYDFFASCGLPLEQVEEFNLAYQNQLGDEIHFSDDAYTLVKSLHGKVKQYAVTNGTKIAQDKKLRKSGLDQCLDGIFISEDLGAEKPSRQFFQQVWDAIGPYDKQDILIVGDSLTSDMQGGNNEGIKCCWYNPEKIPNTTGLVIDFEITDLWQVLDILTTK